jgi:hypothetical protein
VNAALPIAEALPAAERYHAVRFDAFRICEAAPAPYGGPPARTTYSLGEIPASSLDEALNAVLIKCLLCHKEHLAIRETTDRGARVHLYAIKRKSTPQYRYENHQQVRVHPLYAAPLCVIDGPVFE